MCGEGRRICVCTHALASWRACICSLSLSVSPSLSLSSSLSLSLSLCLPPPPPTPHLSLSLCQMISFRCSAMIKGHIKLISQMPPFGKWFQAVKGTLIKLQSLRKGTHKNPPIQLHQLRFCCLTARSNAETSLTFGLSVPN